MGFFYFGFLFELFLFGIGVFAAPNPLGVSPYPDDPALLRAAPADALVYLQWNGNAPAEPGSDNATERLAAEPAVRAFVTKLTAAITAAVAYENRRELNEIQSRAMMAQLWASASVPGCLFVGNAGSLERPSDWQVGLVSRRGERSDAIAKTLATGFGWMGLEMSAADDLGFRRAEIPDAGASLTIGARGDYVIAAFGGVDTSALIERLDSDGPSVGLHANPRYRESASSVAVERPSVRTFVDVQQVRKLATPMMDDEVAAVIRGFGFEAIRAAASTSGLEGGEFVSRAALLTPSRDGVLAMVGGRSLAFADFEIVPADADFATALRIDPSRVLEKLRRLADGVERGASRGVDRALAEFEEETGLDLQRDVLAHCDDTLLAWSAPSQGGLLATGLTVALKLRNPEAAESSLRKLIAKTRLRPLRPRRRGQEFRRMRVEGHTIHWLNTVGDDFPCAPALCVSDTHFLFSLYPQPIAATLRAGSGGPNSLAMAQTVKPTSDTIALGYINSANVGKVGYPMLYPLGQLASSELQREGMPLPMDALPEAGAVVPHLTRIHAVLEANDTGFRFERRSVLPLNDPVFAATAFGMFAAPAIMMRRAFAGRFADGPAPLAVAEKVAVRAAPEVTAEDLERLVAERVRLQLRLEGVRKAKSRQRTAAAELLELQIESLNRRISAMRAKLGKPVKDPKAPRPPQALLPPQTFEEAKPAAGKPTDGKSTDGKPADGKSGDRARRRK